MPVQNPISSLFKRLREAGINTAFVKSAILPEWWKNDMAQNPAMYATALDDIAAALGIPLRVLYDNDAPIPQPNCEVKFKKSKNAKNADILWAAEFGRSIARIVARALPEPSKQTAIALPHSARDIRRHILQSRRTVNLDALLEMCFSCGIPVLHILGTKGATKPHGLATRIDGRTAIVLLVNHKHPSRLAFDLAHELGHIVLGHLEQKQTIVDESIEGISNNDPHEVEANDFAKELLLGNKALKLNSVQQLSVTELINAALRYGADHKY